MRHPVRPSGAPEKRIDGLDGPALAALSRVIAPESELDELWADAARQIDASAPGEER